MSLKDQIQSDVASVFLNDEEFAESITYQPHDGIATSISAIVTDVIDKETGQQIQSDLHITIAANDDDGVAEPKAGDSGILRGRRFRVVERLSDEFGAHFLRVKIGGLA